MASEPGPRDYALKQALFIDSRRHASNLQNIFYKLRRSPYFASDDSLEEPADLPAFKVPDPVFSPEIDRQNKSSDELIVEAIGVDDGDDILKLALEASVPHCRFSYAVRKLELPVLRSDPRHDVKALNKLIAETKQHDFFRRPNPLPFEPVDERKDEGLSFPSFAVHSHSQLAKGAEPDDLDYSEEDVAYRVEALYDNWSDKDFRELVFQELSPARERVRSMTPPLVASPLEDSGHEEHFMPSAKVCEIDPLSEPDSLLDMDLERAEEKLIQAHVDAQLPDVAISDFVHVRSDTSVLELFTPNHHIADLKMDTPILPFLDDHLSPVQDAKDFGALIGDISGFYFENDSRNSIADLVNKDESHFTEQLDLLLKDKSEEMTRISEQEQIVVADATARLQPPVMDFSIPEPEWHGALKTASDMFRWILSRHPGQFNSPPWPKNGLESRELRWIPFPPALGQVKTRESVGDDRVPYQLLGDHIASLLTSTDYVRKRQGLKIFIQDDDEELPIPYYEDAPRLSSFGSGDGVMDLIRKRKLQQTPGDDGAGAKSPTVEHKARRMNNRTNSLRRLEGSLLLSESENHAAGKLLSNYLELHGSRKSKTPATNPFSATPAPNMTRASSSATKRQQHQQPPKALTPQPRRQTPKTSVPSPPIIRLEGETQIVISASLPRNMINAIKKRIPGINLVDRDFSRYNSWAWSPGSTNRVQVQSPLSFEADIIPSPATGIITTTALKVRQKPLPNSPTQQSQLRDRVAKVALLYERLVILVSEDNKIGEHMGPLTESDAEAYTSFVAFASAIGAKSGCCVRVIYVAGGSQALEDWTYALVSAHVKENSPDARQILMDEESEWEVFLRRAGLNMYAAQVVIAIAKGIYPEGNGHAPLVRFLRMDPAQRARTFAAHLGGGANGGKGGQDVMDRVSARLG